MPNASTFEDITRDMSIDPQSRPLLCYCFSNWALLESKILDAYLNRFDGHNFERVAVMIGNGELEQLTGVTDIKWETLNIWIRDLMAPIELKPIKKDRFTLVAPFDEVHAGKDEHGQWCIALICSVSAIEYNIFSGMKSYDYLRNYIDDAACFFDAYTYRLFIYLKH